MKKIIILLLAATVTALVSSCGGNTPKSTHKTSVALDELDDYYTVKSCGIESDAKDKGIEKLENIRGTITLVIQRNGQQIKYKPSDVKYATAEGEVSGSDYYLFRADCEAVVKKILKMEPDTEETFTIGFTAIDPFNKYRSDEENAQSRQRAYEALTTKGGVDQVCIDIDFKEELEKELKELLDDDDDE